jgi:hypothetical protein
MAVRAEDIVRNSEVSARVRAGPPARAVPRVTDALKSATFEPQCHDRPFRVETSHSYPGSQKHRLKGNMNSSRCLTDEVCVRLMSSIVDSSCPRRDSTPIGTIRSHAARRPQRKLSSVISGGGIPSPCASHRPAHCHSRRRPVAPYTRLAVDWTDRHRYPAPHRHPVVHSGIGRLPAVVAQESARNSHPHWLEPKLTRVRRRPQRLPAVRLRAS